MKVTNAEIFNAREPLSKLMEVKLPVRASLAVAKFANKLNEELKTIDDVRNGLIKTHGDKDGDNVMITPPNNPDGKPASKNWDKFLSEFNELMEQEIEMVVDKIKIPEKVTGTCDKCNHNMDVVLQIEPSVLMALEKFIEVN